MPQVQEAQVRTAPERRLAEDWALVLLSQGLSPAVRRVVRGYAVCVPAEQAERATATLAEYLSENPVSARAAPTPAWVGEGPLSAGLAVCSALMVFFLVTGPWAAEAIWFARGAAQSGQIISGEPWRAITALTLHADTAHVLANALAGGLFFTAVFRALGPGLGGAMLLLVGAVGNLANAILHGSDHVSVGASTAVFGGLGLLAGMSLVHRRLGGGRGRAWMPVAASLALLALLGTGGERTDVWAHASGLGVGGALGVLVALRVKRPPGLGAQWALGGFALVAICIAWRVALSPG